MINRFVVNKEKIKNIRKFFNFKNFKDKILFSIDFVLLINVIFMPEMVFIRLIVFGESMINLHARLKTIHEVRRTIFDISFMPNIFIKYNIFLGVGDNTSRSFLTNQRDVQYTCVTGRKPRKWLLSIHKKK